MVSQPEECAIFIFHITRDATAFNPMPDYDFVCQNCKKQFTAHMSIKEHDSRVAECPECKSSKDVQRAISHFNVQTSKKSSAYR